MSGIKLNSGLAAIASSIAPAGVPSEKPRDPSAFADMLNAIDHTDGAGGGPAHLAATQQTSAAAKMVEPSIAPGRTPIIRLALGLPGARSAPAPVESAKAETSDSVNPPSIEAALVALGYAVAPPVATPSSIATPPSSEARLDSGPRVQAGIATTASDPVRVAANTRGDTEGAAASNASDPIRVAANTGDDTEAATASKAWDLSGATPLQDLLRADPTLGFRSLQPRTHLAVANAIPFRADPHDHGAVKYSAAAPPARAPIAPAVHDESIAPPASAEEETPSGPVRPEVATPPPKEVAAATVAPPTVAPPTVAREPSPETPGPVPLSVPRLPDFVATNARDLQTPVSPKSAAAALAPAPKSVKELEVLLDPADLGSVSLKMRLANGKLSIVIGVSNPSTLAAIENERGAIAERIGSAQLSSSDLVIQPQAATTIHSESNDAVDSNAARPDPRGEPGARSEDGGSSANKRDEDPEKNPQARRDRGDRMV